MTEPIAYFRGEWIPISEAKLHVFDLGVGHGTTATEMMRTYRHQPFEVDQHLMRLAHSMSAFNWDETEIEFDQLPDIVQMLAERNGALIAEEGDLGITVFVTGGLNRTYVGARAADEAGLTVCAHSFPLPLGLWRDAAKQGVRLTISRHPAIPKASLDPTVKLRSRAHWTIADVEVARRRPGTRALLVDASGAVTETGTGNVILVRDRNLIAPSIGTTLEGVSLQVTLELGQQSGFVVERRHVDRAELFTADEVWTTSTPFGVLPVTEIDGRPIGTGRPGERFRQIVDAWNDRVGLDIIGQILSASAD